MEPCQVPRDIMSYLTTCTGCCFTNSMYNAWTNLWTQVTLWSKSYNQWQTRSLLLHQFFLFLLLDLHVHKLSRGDRCAWAEPTHNNKDTLEKNMYFLSSPHTYKKAENTLDATGHVKSTTKYSSSVECLKILERRHQENQGPWRFSLEVHCPICLVFLFSAEFSCCKQRLLFKNYNVQIMYAHIMQPDQAEGWPGWFTWPRRRKIWRLCDLKIALSIQTNHALVAFFVMARSNWASNPSMHPHLEHQVASTDDNSQNTQTCKIFSCAYGNFRQSSSPASPDRSNGGWPETENIPGCSRLVFSCFVELWMERKKLERWWLAEGKWVTTMAVLDSLPFAAWMASANLHCVGGPALLYSTPWMQLSYLQAQCTKLHISLAVVLHSHPICVQACVCALLQC